MKIKKCPQCGLEARIITVDFASAQLSDLGQMSGCKKITWCDPEDIADYDAMKVCPRCCKKLMDVLEEKQKRIVKKGG